MFIEPNGDAELIPFDYRLDTGYSRKIGTEANNSENKGLGKLDCLVLTVSFAAPYKRYSGYGVSFSLT